jgi:hypothetical protein
VPLWLYRLLFPLDQLLAQRRPRLFAAFFTLALTRLAAV